MSKFRSLLDAHKAEIEKQGDLASPPEMSVEIAKPVPEGDRINNEALSHSSNVSPTQEPIEPNVVVLTPLPNQPTSRPARSSWNPPVWVLIILFGVVVALLMLSLQKDPTNQPKASPKSITTKNPNSRLK